MSVHRLSAGSAGSPPRLPLHEHENPKNWTDDLPVCHLSGVGFATNQIYREDGFRHEDHEFEDRSIHFRVEDNIFLYSVFDGHNGSRVSKFAAQRMPAEILLGQVTNQSSDSHICTALNQAFLSVEKGYSDSIDDILADKANLLIQIPDNIKDYDFYTHYPELYERMEVVNKKIAGGSTAVVALVANNKLFIANAGCSRALLCMVGREDELRVSQLSVDHCLANPDEDLRLKALNLDTDVIVNSNVLGENNYTRTIGDHSLKTGYREMECLSNAISSPLLADPYVSESIDLTDICGFLVLISHGMCKTLEDATGTEHVNADISSLVAAEFATQSTLNGVAQAVVDKVVRRHHDTFMTSNDYRKDVCQRRKDITLLIRNFNYPLPNGGSPGHMTPGGSSPHYAIKSTPPSLPIGIGGVVGGNVLAFTEPLSVSIPPSRDDTSKTLLSILTLQNTLNSTNTLSSMSTTLSSTCSTQSEDDQPLFRRKKPLKNPLQLDENGCIESYVDFDAFFKRLDKLSTEERELYNSEVELKSPRDAIPEEPSD